MEVLKDRILIEKIEAPKQSNILDVAPIEDGVLRGVVVKIGKLVEDVKELDKIIYQEQYAIEVNIEGKKLFILREYDVIGIL